MTRRVLLIELQAQTPGSKTYATWNVGDKTGNCSLSSGNLIATAASTASFNAARGSISMASGAWYWETTHSFASGTGYVLASGICTGAFAFAGTQLGTDGTKLSAGGPGQDGQCRYNNAVAGDAGTVVTTNIVRHWLDLDAGTYKAAIMGGAWITVASGISGTWFPVAQFTTSTHAITANFGASTFAYTVPDGARSGIYSTGAASAATVYLASEFVLSDPTGTPANTLYEGRLLATSNPSLKRSASCWVWGDEAKISYGELEFANIDGGLEFLRSQIVRDRPVIMRYGSIAEAQNPAACGIWAQAIADRVEFTPNGTMRLLLTDKMAMLDKPLTRAVFPSWVQETSLVDRPKPVCLGKAFSVDPVLTDANQVYFAVHDDAILAIDEVADQADPDVLGVDYTVRHDGVDKVVSPVGKMTTTARGAVKRIASVFTEPFTAWSAGAFDTNPTGWTVSGEASASIHIYQANAGRCTIRNSTAAKLYMERNLGLTAGVSYVVVLNVTAWNSGVLQFHLWNGSTESAVLFRVDSTTRTGTHAFVVTPAAGYATLRVVAAASANCDVELESLDVYTASLIERLPDWLTELCVTRGSLVAGDLDATSISALDTKAPYKLGYSTRDAVMIRDVVRDTMRTFTGWLVPDRDGKLTVGRLEAPSATATLALVDSDLAGIPTSQPDPARNLTTLMGAARNWTMHGDADFAGSVSAQTRAALKAQFREIKKALGIVDPFYIHADTAPPLESLLQLGTDALAEISRVATIYSVVRNTYTVPVFIDVAAALALKFGETVSVTVPYFDLTAGRNLVVLDIEQQFFSNVTNLILWG